MVSDSGRAMYRPPTARTARAAGQAGWGGVVGLSVGFAGGLAAGLAESWFMRVWQQVILPRQTLS